MYLPEQPQWSAQLGPTLANSYDRGINNPDGKTRLRRSPILPDPGYGGNYRGIWTGHVSRLQGPEAKAIYKRATASEGAPFFEGVRCSHTYDKDFKGGKKPKNHKNANLKRIRRIMRETQQRRAVEEKKSAPIPAKALWQSKQHDNVQSKVKQKLDEDAQRSSARPQSVQGNFLRAHENTGPEYLRSQSVNDLRRNSVGSSVNLPTTQIDKKTKPDYVKINSRYVKNIPKVSKSASVEATEEALEKQDKNLKDYKEKTKGRVPDYIEKIKDQRVLAEYEARINAPDPECPPDHVKVDNNQRKSTLQQLQLNRTALEKKLCHLPIRNDTVALRQTKESIEKKVLELDEAIKIFSKPKVFIKLDE